MRTILRAATTTAACLVLVLGPAPAKADSTPFGATVYIGSPDDTFRYTGSVDNATGLFTITGTLVFDGQEFPVVAEGRVGASGLKTPGKRYAASGTATAGGMGEVPVAVAYGSNREEAISHFVDNIIAGVLRELIYGWATD